MTYIEDITKNWLKIKNITRTQDLIEINIQKEKNQEKIIIQIKDKTLNITKLYQNQKIPTSILSNIKMTNEEISFFCNNKNKEIDQIIKMINEIVNDALDKKWKKRRFLLTNIIKYSIKINYNIMIYNTHTNTLCVIHSETHKIHKICTFDKQEMEKWLGERAVSLDFLIQSPDNKSMKPKIPFFQKQIELQNMLCASYLKNKEDVTSHDMIDIFIEAEKEKIPKIIFL